MALFYGGVDATDKRSADFRARDLAQQRLLQHLCRQRDNMAWLLRRDKRNDLGDCGVGLEPHGGLVLAERGDIYNSYTLCRGTRVAIRKDDSARGRHAGDSLLFNGRLDLGRAPVDPVDNDDVLDPTGEVEAARFV